MDYGWTLDQQRWACLVDFLGDSVAWELTRLEEVYRDRVPLRPGVYAICASPPGQLLPQRLYNALYVGKARALRQRFLQHCYNPAPELQRAKSVYGPRLDYWFLEAEEESVAALESYLIHCLGPSVNLKRGILAVLGEPRRA